MDDRRGIASGRRLTLGALVALAGFFAFRLAFGLLSEFWSEDETQIYLLGLGYHATGAWPYFGPDVVWTESQIPGALQALLVGLPFDLLPIPEAPYLLLGVLSTSALCLLGCYVRRRLPELPAWFVFGLLLTTPWTLHFSTHVVNPSYVLPASIVFFVSAFEAIPPLRCRFLSPGPAHFGMGFAIAWIMQVHLSWVLLLPFVAVALASRAREGWRPLVLACAATAAGAALPGSLLLPTLLLDQGAGSSGLGRYLEIHWRGPETFLKILAQFLSFASFEVSRFVGLSKTRRIAFLLQHPWLLPLALATGLGGIAQVLAMLGLSFRRSPHLDWPAVRATAMGTAVLIYSSYLFSVSDPRAHAFYVTAPVALIFSFYCWSFLLHRRLWRKVAAALLVIGAVFHAGLAGALAEERSLYRNRRVVAEAIERRDPWMLSRRRPFAREPWAHHPPRGLETADPPRDLRLLSADWKRAAGGAAFWDIVVRNDGAVAYRDLRYATEYRSAASEVVKTSEDRVFEIVQPGQTVRLIGINDGPLDARATQARMVLTTAEPLSPLALKRER
jgi:hypothetical protein